MSKLLLGEFIGTFVLVFFNNATVASVLLKDTKSSGVSTGWLQISLGSGFAVTFGILAAANLAPAHLNPAVSFGFYLLKRITLIEFLSFSATQILAGFVASAVVYIFYRKHYDQTEDSADILSTFSTSPSIVNKSYSFISEMIATSFLMFGILSIIQYDIPTPFVALLVGLLVFTLGNSVGANTGYAMNPARDLGPRMAHFVLPIRNKGNSMFEYSWIPVLGPVVGAGLVGFLYSLF